MTKRCDNIGNRIRNNENPYKAPLDDIDAIIFGIAEEIGITCELFNISPHPFKPCRKYKWFFSNPNKYFQVEIKGEELWVGLSDDLNKGFPLNDPNVHIHLKNWVAHLNLLPSFFLHVHIESTTKD